MRKAWALTPLVVVGLMATSCGSSSNNSTSSSASGGSAAAASNSSQVATLKSEIQAMTQRPTQIGIKTPLSKVPPKGKTIYYVNCGVPACTVLAQPTIDAGKALGWNIRVVQQGLTPETVKAAWDKVVADKPDGVITTGGFPPSIFKSELAQVAQLGIPAISYADPLTNPGNGFIAVVDPPARQQLEGKLMVDWAVADTNGKANIMFVYTSTFGSQLNEVKGAQDEIAKVCPSCKLTLYDAPATSIGKDLGPKVASRLQANTDVNYVIAGFGDMALGLPQAMRGVGIDPRTKVKIVTQGSGPAEFQMIHDGDIQADYQLPNFETMWQSIDILARHFNGEDLTPATGIDAYTSWFRTKDNMPAGAADFPEVVDYQAQFKKLWKVA